MREDKMLLFKKINWSSCYRRKIRGKNLLIWRDINVHMFESKIIKLKCYASRCYGIIVASTLKTN